jgi:hypothetical protein
MILGRIAIALSIATVLALDLIVLLGAGIQDLESIRPVLGGLVMVMDLCLVSSSSQLGFRFARPGNKRPTGLFFLNIGLFVASRANVLQDRLIPSRAGARIGSTIGANFARAHLEPRSGPNRGHVGRRGTSAVRWALGTNSSRNRSGGRSDRGRLAGPTGEIGPSAGE